jgi:hypothetical protein
MSNGTDGFFGGGVLGLSWYLNVNGTYHQIPELVGVIRGGLIVREPVVQNRTQMGTNTPLLFPDGQPKQQMMVALLCDGSRGGARDERDPTNQNDQGNRQLAIKSYMIPAVREALHTVNAPGLRVGGELYVVLLGKQENGPGDRWAAKYVPPAVALPNAGPEQPAQGNPFGGAAMTGPPVQQPAQSVPAQVGQFSAAQPDPADPWAHPAPAQQRPAAPAPNPFG